MNTLKFEIKFSFLLFVSLTFLYKKNNIPVQFFIVCLLHELGHIIALFLSGGHIKKVIFSGSGINMITEKTLTDMKNSVIAILAGCFVNIIFFILSLFKILPHTFGLLNLASAVYNLLPYRSLDGGTLIYTIFGGTVHEYNVMFTVFILQIILSLSSLVAVLAFGTEFLPVFIVSLILFISERK